ncbi:hypothetical protein [Actinomyces sp. MRS3W]|uniref:hypothetical protein n=1 Tax=Actinomyces sp. MRS3W TaxID=2800796 RepID=UPI0028FD05AF|nr:hypothetical protein [Actinomyces sp. MRS3W]MDU0347870.1 hypothetical protein [Actinomyces sp. MRS3W]
MMCSRARCDVGAWLRLLPAVAAVLLLGCAPLVACSSGPDDASGIPTYDPEAAASAHASESAAAAEASASAAASAEAAGVVTAESLSTDRYEVTSIPEDLDERQTEVLKAFINYDQVTWNIWFTGTGVENAESLMTADAYQILKNNYEPAAGETVSGVVRVAVINVFALSDYQAQVVVCEDQTNLIGYDSSGQQSDDQSSLQVRHELLITFVNEAGAWKDYEESTLSTNECTV